MSENLRNCKIGELFGEFYNHQMGYGLSDWFEALQNKKLRDIRDEDISKLIRQDIIVKYAVLEAVNRIPENPTIGLYDGEVLAELSKLDQGFWRKNDDLRMMLKTVIIRLHNNNSMLENFDWMSESCQKDFWINIEILKDKLLE